MADSRDEETARLQAEVERLNTELERLNTELEIREHLAAALEQKEEDFRKLVDNIPGLFWRVEDAPAWPVIFFSQGAKALTGWTAEEFMEGDVRWIDRTHPDDLDELIEVIGKGVEEKSVFDIEYRFINRDEEVRWVREVGVYFDKEDTPLLDGYVLDVHERKIAELALKRALDDLDAFAAVVSHDLRAPLRNITMAAETIRSDRTSKLSERSLERLALLERRAHSMQVMVDELLSYARAGHQEAASVSFVPSQVASEVWNLVGQEGFAFESEGGEESINTPQTPFETIIRNLVNNALKHHDRADGTISVTFERQDDLLEVTVADDGPGIAPERQEGIFEPFQSTGSRGGVGLGLAVVQRAARAYGGDVTVNSEGRGAAFTFTWPVSWEPENG